MPYLLAFCRLSLALLFAYSFVGKVRDVAGFAQTISRFQLLPPSSSQGTAWLFLGSEGVIVLLLLIGGQMLPLAFGLALLLLLVFTTVLVFVLARSIQTNCNCFGDSKKDITAFVIWRNCGFAICAIVGWIISTYLQTSNQLGAFEWGLVSVLAIVFVSVWTHFEEILNLYQPY